MENQSNFFDELRVIFSHERLDGYLRHIKCNNDKTSAFIAYSWNIELSQALYPALQILEITLRNALHNAMTEHFNTVQWFELPFLHEKEREKIHKIKQNLISKKKICTPGRIVSELSFGFWTSLFDIRYEHNQILWPRLIKPTFPFLPKEKRTRNFISRKLNQIRYLRNRIFHYEPIWHWGNLPNQHNNIINLTKYLSSSASQYLDILDKFNDFYFKEKSDIEMKLNFLNQQQREVY